jgi:hypothetical protein
VVKVNVDTDLQYAFTRAVADHVLRNYDGVLMVDGGLGDKRAYDPRRGGGQPSRRWRPASRTPASSRFDRQRPTSDATRRPHVETRAAVPSSCETRHDPAHDDRGADMTRYLLLQNYEGGNCDVPMSEWAPADVTAHIDFQLAAERGARRARRNSSVRKG